MTNMLIDANGIAHSTSTCEEVSHPTVGDCPADAIARNGFPICADCD